MEKRWEEREKWSLTLHRAPKALGNRDKHGGYLRFPYFIAD